MELAQRLGFDLSACQIVKDAVGGTTLEQLIGYEDDGDGGREAFLAQGLCVVLPEEDASPMR